MKIPNRSELIASSWQSITCPRKFVRRNLLAILLIGSTAGFFAAPANAWLGNDLVNRGRDLNRERKEEQDRIARAAREAAAAVQRAAEAAAKEASRLNEERKRAQ